MSIIMEIVNSLKPVDPVKEAIEQLDTTHLDDDQVDMIVSYMKELIDKSANRGMPMKPQEAAYMALEDVAGFETAAPKVVKSTVNRIVRAYVNLYGK